MSDIRPFRFRRRDVAAGLPTNAPPVALERSAKATTRIQVWHDQLVSIKTYPDREAAKANGVSLNAKSFLGTKSDTGETMGSDTLTYTNAALYKKVKMELARIDA